MANTTNLDLVKPAGTDKALVSVLNSNSDKIDAWAGSTNQALSKVRRGAFCTTAAQVISALDNAVSSDGNAVISISNSSKNDIFTVAANQSIVVVYLNEESVRWDDHPYFIMQAENSLWTGRVGKQSGAWAVQEIHEFVLKDDPSGPFLLLSNDINNSTADITLRVLNVPKAFAITLTKYGENPTVTIKKGDTVLCTFYPTTSDNAWGKQTKAITGVAERDTLTISVTWSHSYEANNGHYNLFAIY